MKTNEIQKTNDEIIQICATAKAKADAAQDNWADYVDGALTNAGCATDEQAARDLWNRGRMNVVAVLADGRVISCWDDRTWHVTYENALKKQGFDKI